MKRFLVIAAALALTACGTIGPQTSGAGALTASDPFQNFLGLLANLDSKDAIPQTQYALNEANAIGDTEGSSCWTYLLAVENNLLQQAQAGAGNPVPSSGVGPAGLIEDARAIVMGVTTVTGSSGQTQFETACGPMILNIVHNILHIGAKAMPFIPNLPMAAHAPVAIIRH